MQVGILGHLGEVGSALLKCYQDINVDAFTKDKHDNDLPELQILNVCIPYSDEFESIVCEEIKQTNPLVTLS